MLHTPKKKNMFMSQEPSVRGQYISILCLTHDSYNSQVRIQDVPGARSLECGTLTNAKSCCVTI